MHLAGIERTALASASGTTQPLLPSAGLRGAAAAAVAASVAVATLALLAGCGSSYRPVVAAINPVGPSAQPQKYAVAISSTGPNSPGLLTIVDFSGDTVLITAAIGAAPQYLVLNSGGNTGYIINGDGTLNVADISNSLISSQILETTLLPGAAPISVLPAGANIYVTERGRNAIGQFQGAPLALRQEINAANPIYVVGLQNSPRTYALSQGTGTNPGQAIAIDTTSNTPTATIPLGVNPVYGVMTADGNRAFVLNRGSGTVSVINAQTNQLDTLPGSTAATPISTINVGTAPLWADFAPTLSELLVANAGDGVTPGSLSIVSIPLCNAAALTINPNCSAANPVDAVGFGTVLANVPVGINPIMVATLQDGTRSYVANAGNANTLGSVSVINLVNQTVTATIPLACHPSYIAATTGTPTGKVYVVCNDSNNMTVIRTDVDNVLTTVPLQGSGVAVRVTVQ